jgi:arylformamidase
MARLLDISPPLSEQIAVWPGDEPYRREVSLDMRGGDPVTLSSVRTTLHVGAHADAPSHYVKDGDGIGERPLGVYYGPCQVMEVNVSRGARILPEDLRSPIEAPRLLIKTDSFPDPTRFNEDFNSLSPELVAKAHDHGVVLIGIDTPSVDPFDDKILESHQELARRDMANLEGLFLGGVEPGLYTLIALPLRLADADASPVRAALLTP